MTTRRDFIKQTGLAAAAVMFVPSLACTTVGISRKAGIQLYTLRDLLPKDVRGVIAKVAGAGYEEVEPFGYSVKDGFWGLPAKDFAQLLKENNLKAPSAHYDMTTYINGDDTVFKSYIDAAHVLGHQYIVVPWLDEKLRTSIDNYKSIAAKFNQAGEWCKKEGLQLAYHNHNFEFQKHGDSIGYDIFLKETDPDLVKFELDLYWVVRAGYNPVKLFQQHPGRFVMWHVKDMDKQHPELNTEVGNGSIDFKRIFAYQKLSGVQHFYMEQENNYKPNELESIRASCSYIKSDLFTVKAK
ncbi:sugar phosphate isomerase/epimerase [Pedobacter sp. BS3]|uniref:sugar phosphate isomerase/epimerase family protein n=1 Tax=Pedobacter sp. BS3 TaxID=2567937 RepID=UPI0011ED7A52|nr:sugar phosphate isomerase/epimerase [Pedobacter sp. BS3]TZF84583.1 sugar phosphate isomerase/epimerase [Pedobacter sp. BS3]